VRHSPRDGAYDVMQTQAHCSSVSRVSYHLHKQLTITSTLAEVGRSGPGHSQTRQRRSEHWWAMDYWMRNPIVSSSSADSL
jgi:hypothetical protein